MLLIRNEIFSSVSKLFCQMQCIAFNTRAASCSVKRISVIRHTHHQKLAPCYDSLGGSPVSVKSFGQPTHFTHPHKVLEGEIVPGLKDEEFRERRLRLIEKVEEHAEKNDCADKAHMIVVPSSEKKYMSEKIPYVFRQNSDFLYLTGCQEPDSVLVMTNRSRFNQENILFIRGKDPYSELWDGPRTGFDQAVDFFSMDRSLPVTEFKKFVLSFVKEYPDCVIWYDYLSDNHPAIHKSMKDLLSLSWSKVWETPRPLIHQLRLYKSPAEQQLMRTSCEIAGKAIKTTIQNSKPFDSEAQIFARVDYECRMNRAEYLAYPPVVAGGNRANIIHYINNDQIIEEGDMVLMDAGCEYHGYTSDITRTWPISGKFSPEQRILYEVVYTIQTELIEMCANYPTLDELFSSMGNLIIANLLDAGIISNKYSDKDLSRAVYAFCPHHVSHYLGMDVHDTGTVSRNIPLEPGMVITVEPGLYVNLNNKLTNPEFRGHGIRIEDDILITDKGPVVLTSSCPKHPDDIENLIRRTDSNEEIVDVDE